MAQILFFLIPGFIATIGFNHVTRSKNDSGYKFLLRLIVTNLVIFSIAILTYDEIGFYFYEYTARLTEQNFFHELKQIKSFLDIEYLSKVYPWSLLISIVYMTFCLQHEKLISHLGEKVTFKFLIQKSVNLVINAFRSLHFINSDPLTSFYIQNTGKKIIIKTHAYKYLCMIQGIGSKNDDTYIKLDVYIIGTDSLRDALEVFEPPTHSVLPTKDIIGFSEFSEQYLKKNTIKV
ncbi:MAG: hypothetical protein AB8G05_27505 [Oligoflexales bacterium]